MKTKKNKVSILMSVYREKIDILQLALNSMLNQTFENFELIIVVDDPNYIRAIDYLKGEAKKDKRIRLVVNERNMGLPFSLNRGIEMIKDSKYIARMDADDVSISTRLEEQYNFLEEHPEIDLVGCGVYFIDESGNETGKRNVGPSDRKNFKKAMGMVNIMSHPTFFGKTEIFMKYKYRELKYAQDYDFVCRVLEKGNKVINLDKYLLYYRKVSHKNIDKATRQFMTQFFVQKYYSKKELNDTDISKIVSEFVNNKRRYNKTKRAVEYYNKSIKLLGKKKKIASLFYMLNAVVRSRYCADRIYKTLKYAILCKRWSNG